MIGPQPSAVPAPTDPREPDSPGFLHDRDPAGSLSVLAIILALVTLVGGGFFAWRVVDYGTKRQSQDLGALADVAAHSLDPREVRQLRDAVHAGVVPPDTVCEQMRRIHRASPHTRFVYLLAPQGEDVVFLADAENPQSDDYSPPGTVYGDLPEGFRETLLDGRARVRGPYRDDFGSWVTGIAAVRDEGGKPIAVLGIDITAERYESGIAGYRNFAVAIVALFAIIVVLTVLMLQMMRRHGTRLQARLVELQGTQEQLHLAAAELRTMSSVDGLTGVANRRRFDEALAHEWERAAHDGSALSLLMIDIDCFKPYNDRHGHPGGDACLLRVARAIREAGSRATDIVARYGGEEFAVILPATQEESACAIAERIHAAIAGLRLPHGAVDGQPYVTVSIGVASRHPGSSRAEELVAAADRALYAAKRLGRNRVVSEGEAVRAG